jgi:hypothetical protein
MKRWKKWNEFITRELNSAAEKLLALNLERAALLEHEEH